MNYFYITFRIPQSNYALDTQTNGITINRNDKRKCIVRSQTDCLNAITEAQSKKFKVSLPNNHFFGVTARFLKVDAFRQREV